jgi:hypothetical protein
MLELARKYWIDTQHKGVDKGLKDAVATGKTAGTPRGWCYHEETEGPAYGSMSAGAVGAVCIYDAILGTNWKKDKSVADGMAWLDKNFSVADNPHKGKYFHYYYLYAIERAGMLYDTPLIGAHDWYLEGANRLLDDQRADGSWGSEERLDKPEGAPARHPFLEGTLACRRGEHDRISRSIRRAGYLSPWSGRGR